MRCDIDEHLVSTALVGNKQLQVWTSMIEDNQWYQPNIATSIRRKGDKEMPLTACLDVPMHH
ncbi:MAG: hypothetical protein ABI651_05450 [Verrucomicrobiota bacterium]